MLTDFFTNIKLPYASWYVDSPAFILEDFKKQISPYLSIFVWDHDYIGMLKDKGFENVFFLPLATDPDQFRKIDIRRNPLSHLACDIGFVGSSGDNVLNKCLSEICADHKTISLLEKVANQFVASNENLIELIDLQLSDLENQLYNRLMKTMKDIFEPAITWRATQIYRISCVKKLNNLSPHIHGDPGWHQHMNGQTVIGEELNYYNEVPYFYNVCKVNFNTTSLQMKGGVNQRVFDVPACGGFLLTDSRAQLDNMFKAGSEVICYNHPDEINDLARYYLKHPAKRTNIVDKACTRVLKEHTYMHRINRLTRQMIKSYG